MTISDPMIEIRNLNVYYDDHHALKEINADVPENKITAIMGPSGCGKSTFIKCINRMIETIEIARVEGKIKIGEMNLYDPSVEKLEIRKKIGMVFQEPNPLPMSIKENVLYGPKIHNFNIEYSEKLKYSLKAVGLWEEVKDRLEKSAFELSGGQQQRLCIARALAVEPNIILMDEPTSSLDPVSTKKIENLLTDLRDEYGITVLVVTHDVHEAKRIADHAMFLYLGKLLEDGPKNKLFENPEKEMTKKYLKGKL